MGSERWGVQEESSHQVRESQLELNEKQPGEVQHQVNKKREHRKTCNGRAQLWKHWLEKQAKISKHMIFVHSTIHRNETIRNKR